MPATVPSSVNYDHISSEIQHTVLSAVSNAMYQQIQSYAYQIPQKRYKYDESYLRAYAATVDAATLEKFKQRRKVSATAIVQEQKVVVADVATTTQQEVQATPCAQMLAALATCFQEDELFWSLRDNYVNMGCQERVNNIQDKGISYAIPYGITASFYALESGLGSVISSNAEGSAIGIALLASAPPMVMCSIAYIGGSYKVSLIKNYREDTEETNALKMVRETAEKYAEDLQQALDAISNIKTAEIVFKKPIYYAMCYGYEDDANAKIVTIVDAQSKQHVFVVPNNATQGAFQISDKTKDTHILLPYRYFVPQSIINALVIT